MNVRLIKTETGYTVQGRRPHQTKWTHAKTLYRWDGKKNWMVRDKEQTALKMFFRFVRTEGHKIVTIFGRPVG